MKRMTVTLLSLLIALTMSVGVALAAPAPAEFTDPAGDAGPGPDITKIVVSADDAGLVTFRVEIPNRQALSATQFVLLEIDTDANSGTGNEYGSEVLLGGTATGFGIGRWNGSDFGDPTRPASLRFSYGAGAATFTISRTDLGLTSDTFYFWAGTTDNFDDPANWDPAPEYGSHAYSLVEKPTLQSMVVPATALLAKPGKMLSARGVQVRLSNDEIVNPDTLTCTLKIAGKAVPTATGGCKWRIPAAAAGKRGTLTIELSYDGEFITQRYPVKVGR